MSELVPDESAASQKRIAAHVAHDLGHELSTFVPLEVLVHESLDLVCGLAWNERCKLTLPNLLAWTAGLGALAQTLTWAWQLRGSCPWLWHLMRIYFCNLRRVSIGHVSPTFSISVAIFCTQVRFPPNDVKKSFNGILLSKWLALVVLVVRR